MIFGIAVFSKLQLTIPYMFCQNFENYEQLVRIGTAPVNTIIPDMRSRNFDTTVRRAYLCLKSNGNQFEHFL